MKESSILIEAMFLKAGDENHPNLGDNRDRNCRTDDEGNRHPKAQSQRLHLC